MESSYVGSPFKSVLDSVGPQHEKALKQAFYNTAAIIFALLSSVVAISAYYVLEVFLRPLIWAALCGTFLFPFKKTATRVVRAWLKHLEEENTPFLVGVTMLPLMGVVKSADFIGQIVKANYKLMVSIFILVPLCYYLVVFHPFYQIFYGVKFVTDMLAKILSLFNYPLAVWTLFIGYVILVFSYKKPSSEDSSTNINFLKYLSVGVWFMMLFHLASLAGTWKVPLALLLLFLIILGIIGEQKNSTKNVNEEQVCQENKKQITVKKVVDRMLTVIGIHTPKPLTACSSSYDLQEAASVDTSTSSGDSFTENVINEPEVIAPVKLNPSVEALKSTPLPTKKNTDKKPVKHKHKRKRIGKSDPYFIALFWLFAISRVWLHSWVLEIVPVLLVIFVVKFVYSKAEFGSLILGKTKGFRSRLHDLYVERRDIIFPGPVKGAIFMMHRGDQKLISWIHSATDKLMTALIILCLGILVLLGAAFFAVQVHQESAYLITVATDVVNRTVVSNQDYLRLLNLNDTDIKKSFDDAVHGAYVIGRQQMVTVVSSYFKTQKSNNSAMEHQVEQFLDQLYYSWAGKNDSKKEKGSSAKKETHSVAEERKDNFLWQQWNTFSKILSKRDLSKLYDIGKSNMHTLYSVVESVWSILKGNVNLMFSIITHIISLVLFSGTYLLNSLISTIVFSTTLFYLLSASSDSYKLMDWFASASMGTRLGESINNAIQDVFGASLKMATFYGLYTWLTHSVFGANLIFIPAALAATFGVVPFIGTYWAAVPATLELWLIQQEGLFAILLLSLHMLPTYVVDTAIYSEIGGGGHPYLTGLAVAGGVYCIGLEGAFVGPIVLCCLIAAFDVYNGIMNDSNPEQTTNTSSVRREYRRAFSENRL